MSADATGIGLDDVLARVRELPTWLRSLRVETKGWSDHEMHSLASDRARGLLVRRIRRSADAPARRSETRTRSWMEFGDGAWEEGFIGLWPARWREEHEWTSADGKVSRLVSGRDGDAYWWDHGDGAKVTDARRLRPGLASAWVVGRRWARVPAQRDLVDVTTSVLGRSVARIRVTPDRRAKLDAGPLYAGDAHEITVDTANGMTLAVTSFVDGAPFQHHEVTELEVDAAIAPALTEAPRDAEAVPPSQSFRNVQEVAAATQLTLLAPTWLPPGYAFQTGGVHIRDGVPSASVHFSRERKDFVSVYEFPESMPRGDDVYEWERVERGARTVLISDLGDQPGQRVAHTVLNGTMAVIHAALPAADLLELAFSLEVVSP
jgi:hypothetical protein